MTEGVYVGSYGLLFEDDSENASAAWAVNVVPAGVASSYFKVVRGQDADMEDHPCYQIKNHHEGTGFMMIF